MQFPVAIERGLVLAVLSWGLISCGSPGTGTRSLDLLRRGLTGEPSSLDPGAVTDIYSEDVIRDVYEGLTAESPSGDVTTGVADSWTVDTSGTQYTFRLRSDARWSNGRSVVAQDFVNAWRRVVDPMQGSPVADTLRIIVGAASIIAGNTPPASLGAYATNDRTLVVKLEQPAPYLPQLFTHAATYPVYSDASARNHDPKLWVSNGPYVLANWLPGSKISLTKNPYYWDRGNVRIKRVEYQVVPDDGSQLARYRAGQLDMTDEVPANEIPDLRKEHPQELVIAPFLGTAYYGLNMTNGSIASKLKLRQALAMAIDRNRVVTNLGFGQASAYSFVPPGTWNYSSQYWGWRDLSDSARVVQAQKLYADAGYSKNNPLRLRVIYNVNPAIRNTAVVIASMWKNVLGVESTLDEEEYRVFLQTRHDKARWDVARLAWSADYDDASNFLDILREHSTNNDEGYTNHAFDDLLDRAARTADPIARRKLLESSEKLMLNDYAIVPIYFMVSKRLVKTYINGYQSNPLNHIASKALTMSNHKF